MKNHKEEWRPIPGYFGHEASDQGRIRTWVKYGNSRQLANSPRIKKQFINERGYFCVSISDDNKRELTRRVHSLVALAFIGPRPDGREVCHLNCIKTDNRPCNLAYDTHAENVRQTVEKGLQARGTRQGAAKLDDEKVRQIRKLHAEGKRVNSLARQFGVTHGAIHHAIKRSTWKHVS